VASPSADGAAAVSADLALDEIDDMVAAAPAFPDILSGNGFAVVLTCGTVADPAVSRWELLASELRSRVFVGRRDSLNGGDAAREELGVEEAIGCETFPPLPCDPDTAGCLSS
jgi:hypothetical protein